MLNCSHVIYCFRGILIVGCAAMLCSVACAGGVPNDEVSVVAPAKRLPQSEFNEIPGVVRINLGELRSREEYVYEVPILNASNESIQLAEARTSCKCVLGIIRDTVLAPNQQTILKLKISPGTERDFRRTLALLGPQGSGKSIALHIEASVKEWVSFDPPSLEFTDDLDTARVLLTPNFGLQFGDLAIATSRDLDWSLVVSDETSALFEVKRRKDESGWGTAGAQTEKLVLRPGAGSANVELSIPFVSVGQPVIRPKTMQIREDLAAKFFLVGGIKLLQSEDGDINLMVVNARGESTGDIAVRVESHRLATCLVTFSEGEVQGFSEREEFVIRNKRDNELVGRVNIDFGARVQAKD